MSDIPSISIGSITGGQNNIGKTEIAGDQVQNNHYGQQVPTIAKVLSVVAESLPEAVREEMTTEVIQPIEEEAKLLAAMPPEEAEEKKPTVVERVTALCGKLAPYAPAISKSLAAMGEASLVAIAPPASWIVGALVAAVRAAIPKDDSEGAAT